MDYLYGKLNKEVEKVLYKGLETETANVIVDNITDTIAVEIKEKDPTLVWATWS